MPKKDGIKLVEGAELLITTRNVEVNDSHVWTINP